MKVGSLVELNIGEPLRGTVTEVLSKVAELEPEQGEVGHVRVAVWEDGFQDEETVAYAYEGNLIEVNEVQEDDPRNENTLDPIQVLAERGVDPLMAMLFG